MTEEIAHPLVPHGAVPKSIPQHLQGEVWDFRNEPDGRISFQHPKASIGLSPDKSRVYMTPDEYKLSFDPAYRMMHLQEAANSGYAPLQRIPKTPTRQWNDSIASGIGKALDWGGSSQGKAVGTAGLLSALAGGVGGYLWGPSKQEGGSPIKRALLAALLAGGVGAAGTAWAQNKHNRREAWLSKQASTDWTPLVIQLLNNDPSINYGQRALILRALASARSSDQEDLYRLLRTATGAGIGALAVRFLGSKGLLPMIAGGILGGALGYGYDAGPSRNILGQVSITDYL